MRKVIAIDYDGTLTNISTGALDPEAIEVVKELIKQHDCILWTCREGIELDIAIRALKNAGVYFEWVNRGPKGGFPKVIADLYIDDLGLCPINWKHIYDILITNKKAFDPYSGDLYIYPVRR